MNIEILDRYQCKEVRDLAWLISSNQMFDTDNSVNFIDPPNVINELQNHVYMLQWLDNEPSDINLSTNPLLGKYFESLFELWIRTSPHYNLLFHNEQISDGGRTLTELDFIIERKSDGAIFHIETALKYYLGYNDTSDSANWIGPNANDTLSKKLNTAFSKQLTVFDTKPGKLFLQEHSISNIKSLLFLKGYLFVNFFERKIKVPNGVTISENCYWLPVNRLQEIDGKNIYWIIAPKRYWVSPLIINPGELKVLRWPEIVKTVPKEINKLGKTIMLIGLQKIHGKFYEQQRIMVTPANWPD